MKARKRSFSWRDYYFAARRRWYAGFGFWGIAAAVSATVNFGMPLLHPARVVHATSMVVGAVGSMSSNPRVQAGIVTAVTALMILAAMSPNWSLVGRNGYKTQVTPAVRQSRCASVVH
jgi:hypothetical protein